LLFAGIIELRDFVSKYDLLYFSETQGLGLARVSTFGKKDFLNVLAVLEIQVIELVAFACWLRRRNHNL